METFSDRVKKSRKAAKLTQTQLAKVSGLSQATISDIERGRNASSRDVVALASALKVSAEWLTNGSKAGADESLDYFVRKASWVYQNASQEGRDFLNSSVEAAARTFCQDRRMLDVPFINDRRK